MVIFQLSNAVAAHVQGCIERYFAAHEPPNNVAVHVLGITAPTCCCNPRVDEQWLPDLRGPGTSSCLFGVSDAMMENYEYNEVRGNAKNLNALAEQIYKVSRSSIKVELQPERQAELAKKKPKMKSIHK